MRNIGNEFVASLKRWSIAIGLFIAGLVGLLIWRW